MHACRRSTQEDHRFTNHGISSSESRILEADRSEGSTAVQRRVHPRDRETLGHARRQVACPIVAIAAISGTGISKHDLAR